MRRLILVLVLVALPVSAEVPKRNVGKATLTFYWMIDESSSRYRHLEQNSRLRDMRGQVLARTSRRFLLDLVREGTGSLKDGRTVVFVRRVDGESRFRVSTTKYGLSSNGCPLVPFRTIAADPHWIRNGSKLYIPQLKGTKLPDGTAHDGMFVATDRGHFGGSHVDIFTGAGPRATAPFIRHGNRSRSHVTVYVVEDGDFKDCKP
ncbi:MAG TPA: 3D domain-containing protein [Thermoanaerobaculia bacterium]|nr:3D domain-containing protein [Thermoanaerobaculia bacterium]